MKVRKIEHIAIAVKSISKMKEVLEDKLGLELEYEEALPQYAVRLAMYPVGETYLELLESDDPQTNTSKWITEHGEGLFHICLQVDDIDAALKEMREKGVKLRDEVPRVGHGGNRIAFLDPESTGNVLIEFVEISQKTD